MAELWFELQTASIVLCLQIEALYRDWLESECYKEKLNQRRVKRLQEARGKAAVQDIELTHCIQLKKQFMLAAR